MRLEPAETKSPSRASEGMSGWLGMPPPRADSGPEGMAS